MQHHTERMNLDMKKRMRTLLSVTLVTALLCNSASAMIGDENYEAGSSFDWSPTLTHNNVIVDNDTMVTVNTMFTFDETGAQANSNAGAKHFTIEHNARSAANIEVRAPLNAFYYLCTFDHVHYDLDDDDGDGNSEEVEAIDVSEGSEVGIEPDRNYVFITRYYKPSALSSGTILTIAQRSINIIEHQAIDADYLGIKSWSAGTNARATASVEAHSNKNIAKTSPQTQDKLYAYEVVSNKEELDSLIQEKKAFFTSYLDNNTTTNSRSLYHNSIAPVTLTFSRPISVSELSAILAESNATLRGYQAKFTDEDGNWRTFGSCDMNETRMVQVAQEITAEAGISHVSYEGITSAIVSCNVVGNTVKTMNENPLIYFADISEYIWRNSAEYDPNVDIVVPAYDRQLANAELL